MFFGMYRLFLCIVFICYFSAQGFAADAVIIGNFRARPIANAYEGVRRTFRSTTKFYTLDDVKGSLKRVVAEEDAKVVIAFGERALEEALRLPENIPVIYTFVVVPPKTTRGNTTGIYIGVPAKEYLSITTTYFPHIHKITTIGEPQLLNYLASRAPVEQQPAETPYDFIRQINHTSSDAILLLPDSYLLTAETLEAAYLYSFRAKIPLLGISERQAKEGALFSLVVNTYDLGKQIGQLAAQALDTGTVAATHPVPAKKHDLYLNLETARKMGIRIPDSLIRQAQKVFP